MWKIRKKKIFFEFDSGRQKKRGCMRQNVRFSHFEKKIFFSKRKRV